MTEVRSSLPEMQRLGRQSLAWLLIGLCFLGVAGQGSAAESARDALAPNWNVTTVDNSCFLNGSQQGFAIVFNWRKEHPSGLTLFLGANILAKGGSFGIDASDPVSRWDFPVEATGRLIGGSDVERLKAALVHADAWRVTLAPAGGEPRTFDAGLRGAKIAVAMFDACVAAVGGDSPSGSLAVGSKERRPFAGFYMIPMCYLYHFYDMDDGTLQVTLEGNGDWFRVRMVFEKGQSWLIDASEIGGPARAQGDGRLEFPLPIAQSQALRRDLIAGQAHAITVHVGNDSDKHFQLGGAGFAVPAAMFDACVVKGTGGAPIPPSPRAALPDAAQ